MNRANGGSISSILIGNVLFQSIIFMIVEKWKVILPVLSLEFKFPFYSGQSIFAWMIYGSEFIAKGSELQGEEVNDNIIYHGQENYES